MNNINYNQLNQIQTSFQLTRTNPKLTGNVKINIDSSDEIFLDSIESTSILSDSRFKRFSINNGKAHAANIYSFFNNTPEESIFALQQEVEPNTTSSQYRDQYDFDKYYSGVYYLNSKFYDEKFNMFAPLFLNEKLPNYFVIFKIPHPINEPIDENQQKYPFDTQQYFNYFLENATIVKNYDLTKNSKIGKYIREYLSNDNLPKSGLKVRFEDDVLTTWNGPSVQSGVISSRGEYLAEFFQTGYPIKYFERYITEGFQRNSIIYPRILNLNFLFNDDTSDIYDFNRYVGFYVNDIDIDSFDFDLNRLIEDDTNLDNQIEIDTDSTPVAYENDDFLIQNNNGINIPYANNELDLRDIYSASTYSQYQNNTWQTIPNNESFITCIKDSNRNLHKINGVDINQHLFNLDKGKNGIQANLFYGSDSNFIIDDGSNPLQFGFSNTYLNIVNEIDHSSKIHIYHPLGSKINNGEKYDEIVIINNYSQIPQGSYYWFYDENNIYGGDIYYINGTGPINTISSAISGIINQIKAPLEAFDLNGLIVIKSTLSGSFNNQFAIEYLPYFNRNNLQIEGENIINQRIQFKGGTQTKLNRLVIDADHLDKITNNLDNLIVKTKSGWSKIDHISRYADIINDDNISDSIIATKNDYLNNIVLILSDIEEPDVSSSQFNIKTIFKPNISLLSFFPIKDFDYDFYRSKYTRTPIWEAYQYFYIPPEVNILQPNTDYELIGSGEIEVENTRYQVDSNSLPFVVSKPTSYTRIRGNATVIYADTNNTVPIYDENSQLDEFSGFFTLRDESIIDEETETPIYQFRNKLIGGRLNTEYDFHRENFNQDFAYLSKLQPFICKWGLSKDARDNPYRLNTDFVFGINNFAPEHFNSSQDSFNLSHEWYYIQANYPIISDEPNLQANNYNYFNQSLDLDKLLTDSTEFNNYFTFTPTDSSNNGLDQPQDRYSIIRYNSNSGLNETFFRGVKIRFKDVQNKQVFGTDNKPVFKNKSRRFDNYKFTVLLRPIQEDINEQQSPIEYRFIEHSEFNYIILLIDFYIGDISQIDFNNLPQDNTSGEYINNYDSINGDYRIEFNNSISNLSYLLLYTLTHKKYNNKLNKFSNIKLPFIIDFSTIDNDTFQVLRFNNSSYILNIRNDIVNFNDRNLIIAHYSQKNIDYFLTETNPKPNPKNPLSNTTKDQVIFNITQNKGLNLVYQSLINAISIPSLGINNWRNLFTFKQLGAGENYFANLLSNISFAQIKEFINNYNSIIQYQSYDSSGQLTDTNDYYVEIVEPNIINKQSEIVATPSDVVPSQFSDRDVADYNYIRVDLNENPILYRYNGNYDPVFTDLFKFEPSFKFNYNNYDNIDLANIKINTKANNFGIISNLNFLKISDSQILKLENDDQFNPKFELLDEIPIDHKNFFIFRSNWDFGFHQKHVNKSNFVPVAGTLRIEEDNSFVGKAINLPDSFNVYDFSTNILSEDDNINAELTNEYNGELLYRELEDSFEGIIDLNKAITRYLINDGIDREFLNYLVESDEYIGKLTLTEYIEEYIRLNILELYGVNRVLNFIQIEKQQSQQLNITGLNQIDAANNNYQQSKNIEINNIDRLILYFNVSKDDRGLIKYNPIINIELI